MSSSTTWMAPAISSAPPPAPRMTRRAKGCWVEEVAPPHGPPDAMAILDRRIRIDPDIWIVEAEDRHGTAGLRMRVRLLLTMSAFIVRESEANSRQPRANAMKARASSAVIAFPTDRVRPLTPAEPERAPARWSSSPACASNA